MTRRLNVIVALLTALALATPLWGAPKGPAGFSVGDVVVSMDSCGSQTAVFSVTLFPARGRTVTVHYATADGTALAGGDYTAVAGTLTFPPGSESQQVTIPIADVYLPGPDKTFFLRLSQPMGAMIADGEGMATIRAPTIPRCQLCGCEDGSACTADSCGADGRCRNVHISRCAYPVAATRLPLPSGSSCQAVTGCDIPDSDGDGLNDAWELQGGIDLNCDGVLDEAEDVLLPGADLNRRDIYLQYDYMELSGEGGHTHNPNPEAIQMVVDSFVAQGITLQVDPEHRRLEHHSVITFDSHDDPACHGPDAVRFYDLKDSGSAAKRRLAYHYAVFGHYLQCDSFATCAACPVQEGNPTIFGATGRAELPGNDFVVTTGGFFDFGFTPTVINEAGLVQHELGHNFGLQHGGMASFPNFKPNHLSVLNYSFTFTGIPFAATPGSVVPVGARVDYSRAVLPSLGEQQLDENVGISAGTNDITTYNCPDTTPVSGPGTGPIDWNCNENPAEFNVAADVNADGAFGSLTGYNDWANVLLSFQCSAAGSANALPPPEYLTVQEPAVPEAFRQHRLFSPRSAQIQIRPGCTAATAAIAPGQPGEVTLALLAAEDFDPNEVDLASLKFAGASPVRLGSADVNGDGRSDLLMVFDMSRLRLRPDATAAQLTGWLKNSQVFIGEGQVVVTSRMGLEPASCRN